MRSDLLTRKPTLFCVQRAASRAISVQNLISFPFIPFPVILPLSRLDRSFSKIPVTLEVLSVIPAF